MPALTRISPRGIWRRRRRGGSGRLSVLVIVREATDGLGSCLESLQAQAHDDLEVIVLLPAGAEARSMGGPRLVKNRAVRFLPYGTGTPLPHWQAGLSEVSGEYLTFVDAAGAVLPGGYGEAVSSLRDSGSDFAVFPYTIQRTSQSVPAEPAVLAAHTTSRSRTILADFPDVMVNVPACTKVVRSSFWHDHAFSFSGDGVVDQQLSASLFARANTFDVVTTPGYAWSRLRVVTARRTPPEVVRARLADALASVEQLRGLTSSTIATQRSLQLLQLEVAQLSSSLRGVEDSVWQALREAVTRLVDGVDSDTYTAEVPAELKVLYALVRSDRRDAAEVFVVEGGLQGAEFPTSRTEDGWVVRVPFFGEEQHDVPPGSFLLSDSELPVHASIRAVRHAEPGVLDVYGWAFIENVDLAEIGQTIRARAEPAGRHEHGASVEGGGVPLEVVPTSDNEIDVFAGTGSVWCDHRPAAFTVRIPLERLTDGTWQIRLDLVVADLARTSTWGPVWPFGTGAIEQAIALDDGRLAVTSAAPGGPLRITVDRSSRPRPAVNISGRGEVVAVETRDESLVLTLDTTGLDVTSHRAVYDADQHTVPAELVARGDDRAEIVLPLVQSRWGMPGLAIPSGFYRLRLVHTVTGDEVIPVVRDDVLARVPLDIPHDLARLTLVLRALVPRAPVLHVRPPLHDDERGRRNQARLRSTAMSGGRRDHSVFFRNLFGETTDDSALAIHHELRRRGSDLTLYWSVRDLSVPVPEGGVPVIEGSEEWHRRLGGASYVVVNQHQPLWYAKPSGQRIVQTFHGYPYKMMGKSWWELREETDWQVARFLARAAEWDFLVSPSGYATPHLLREFFTAEAADRVQVVETGYPRNDVLLGADTDQIRTRVRDVLGIGPDQTAVLYAPTFRDYLSANDLTAKTVDFLDPVALTRRLGPDYVLLMRGHAFHARANIAPVDAPQIRDVTYYPAIADLCLASDAAILDYSSLRFDYALTRKPMLFLVPDKHTYHANRPAIIDYDPTAPGPHLDTTAQVADQLRDLPALISRYRHPIENFIATHMEHEDGHAAARVVDQIFTTP